jgi:hypothetical protein
MNVVVHFPARNVGWRMTFSTNGMFVFTPRTRNSLRARSRRLQDSMKFRLQAETFTSSES